MTRKEQQELRSIIRERIKDYDGVDFTAERARLVALWKQHHPEAAAQTSQAHHVLDLVHVRQPGEPKDNPDEIWENDIYSVTLRRRTDDPVFGSLAGMIQLGINALDGTARHDWRELQWIKNQLAGQECEAFELYPAESRLLDPSNYYTLWCFPGVKRIKVGKLDARRVRDREEALAPQRGLPK